MIETRERKIVTAVARFFDQEKIDLEKIDARAHSLPAMVRRHGPAKTLLFLASKEKSDDQLAHCLIQAMGAALGEDRTSEQPASFGEKLARSTELPLYLLEWEAATEAASWIKMMVDARQNGNGSNGQPTAKSESPQEADK